MKKLEEFVIDNLYSIKGGKRTVRYEDLNGDGTLDKIVTRTRNGVVVKQKVKYK